MKKCVIIEIWATFVEYIIIVNKLQSLDYLLKKSNSFFKSVCYLILTFILIFFFKSGTYVLSKTTTVKDYT